MTAGDNIGLAEQLRLAMGRQASHAIRLLDKGVTLQKVDPITQAMRIAVCEACPRFEPDHRQCRECLCPMDYKTSLAVDPVKTMSGETSPDELKISCPLRKW